MIIYPQIIKGEIEEDRSNHENTIKQPSNDLHLPRICEGFIYVAGYVAKLLHQKFPTLGCNTSSIQVRPSPWLKTLSRGRLLQP
uniref:Uncharacterized protein n=1 Tax=Lepeophtheirus salmonis TaxID=72036 RepID=A0A0K2SVM8_LEPSM